MEPTLASDPHAGMPVDYQTDPSRYRHWRLALDGPVATVTMDVQEDGGIRPGYKLKLNSYDLGVDIELHDLLQRIRFEHPSIRVVVITSAKNRVFCSGANIYMLGQASHAEKANFCKFTNETRNGIEDSSARCGLKFIAALNGACAGGGYELALACDDIVMIADRSSTVSLPEVPLLATLTVSGPDETPNDLAGIIAAGALWWPLAMARELDDALLLLRANHREIGTVVLKTAGAGDAVLASDRTMLANRDHWLVRETI